jgi:hypothetical protein
LLNGVRRHLAAARNSLSLPGLTLQSILFENIFIKMDGCAGLRRAEDGCAAASGWRTSL